MQMQIQVPFFKVNNNIDEKLDKNHIKVVLNYYRKGSI